MNLSVAVLAIVFALIVVRRVAGVRVQIWQAMLGGALAVLVTGEIAPARALAAIDLDVMLFLFGVFVIGQALEESGYLYHLAYGLFARARSADTLLLLVLFGAGLASAVLMNDTLAIIGTPLVLKLAHEHRMPPKVLLMALAVAVTLGSVMSPIGNPQNLLIAVQGGMREPFGEFLRHLALPTLLNLGLAFAVLRFFYHGSFHRQRLEHERVPVRDRALARLARAALLLLIGLCGFKVVLTVAGAPRGLSLTGIALIAAAPVLVLSPKRFGLLRRLDWRTLGFFAAMFVLMAAVWDSNFFQPLIARLGGLTTPGPVFATGVLVSQAISNVPLVALLLPMLTHAGADTPVLLALAAGSTLAGNLLILGAASNVIILQNAERRGAPVISFLEFAKVGVPLTAVNALVYWVFLSS